MLPVWPPRRRYFREGGTSPEKAVAKATHAHGGFGSLDPRRRAVSPQRRAANKHGGLAEKWWWHTVAPHAADLSVWPRPFMTMAKSNPNVLKLMHSTATTVVTTDPLAYRRHFQQMIS